MKRPTKNGFQVYLPGLPPGRVSGRVGARMAARRAGRKEDCNREQKLRGYWYMKRYEK